MRQQVRFLRRALMKLIIAVATLLAHPRSNEPRTYVVTTLHADGTLSTRTIGRTK